MLLLRCIVTTTVAFLLFFSPRIAAADPPKKLSDRRGDYLPVSQVKKGMRGYGLTVFRGNKIERFDVTVLGVLHKVNNGRDLILVKLGGPNMRRVTDVIAGMSGSPVYIGGKIVGAVAYGSEFTRESIGYLTPFEDMLDAWNPALPRLSRAEAPTKTLPYKGQILRPLATKVTISGVPQRRFGQAADTLRKLGLEARRGGAGGGAAPIPRPKGLNGSPLQPGGAIALSLATGDLDITGIGTLTYRRGREVIAFGHPFLGIGPIDAPMSTAYIHDIEPSFAESHKIGSPVALVGAFSQDRPFSIAGRIGATPVMTPITVQIRDRTQNRDRLFRAKVIRHPRLTPVLAPMAAGAAIAEVHGQPGDAMATVTTTVTAEEVGTITRTNRFYDATAIDAAATGDLDTLMSLLTSNPFYPLGIRSVKMDVTIEPGRKTAQVERIFLKQTKFAPGETVEVGVVLKPYKKERQTRSLRLRLPDNTPSGMLQLIVQGGGSSGSGGGAVLTLGGMTFRSPADFGSAATIGQLVRRYQERERNDVLTAKVLLLTTAVSIRGEALGGLPPHIEAAMRGGGSGTARTSAVRSERDELKVSELTPYVLSGAQSLAIQVVRPGGPVNAAAPLLPSSPQRLPSMPPGTSDSSNNNNSGITVLPLSSPDGDSLTPRSEPPISIPVGPPPTPENVEPARVVTAAPVPSGPSSAPLSAGSSSTKAVGRMPGIWRLSGAAAFRAATLNGVTVASDGEVRLAPKLNRIAESTDAFFWSLAPDGANGVFVGSGDNGTVYQVNSGGQMRIFAQTGEMEVHSLARANDGTLFAGTSPHGKVFRIGSDGKPKLLLQTGEKYVFALALSSSQDTLYVGTGKPKAKVHAVTLADSTAKTLYESDEGSVTALAVAPGGSDDVYAGTASGGLVLRIAPNAKPQVLYDAAEAAITGLAVDNKGIVYAAAAAPRGVLYRIGLGEAARVLYEKAPAETLTNLQMSPDGTLYTASGSTVIAVSPDGATVRTTEAPSDIQILSLLLGQEGRLWAATGNVGSVYAFDSANAPEGMLTSPVFDARATATWGTARLSATAPAGIYLQTRSGNTSQPDNSWSEWSLALPAAGSGGASIPSPPGRYLQWRATLETGKSGNSPALHGVEVYFRTPNQPPQMALIAPRSGDVLSGTQTIRWSGSDPDRDALAFEVEVSGDSGKTWQPLKSATLPTTRTRNVAAVDPAILAEKQAAEQRMIQQVEAELNKHPEISPEMRARILADTPRQLRDAVNTPSPPTTASPTMAAAATRETSVPLDTTRWNDGVYQVRVTASDKPANPEGALTAAAVSGEFRVVNRPPLLVPFKSAPTVRKDQSVQMEGVALHPSGALVRAVQFRVDGAKEWTAAAAQDGIFDGTLEQWLLVTSALAPGTHTIEVQAIDEAGNTATEKIAVTVS